METILDWNLAKDSTYIALPPIDGMEANPFSSIYLIGILKILKMENAEAIVMEN